MSTPPSAQTLSSAYKAARERMSAIAQTVSADQERRNVPTCPAWDVRDLVSHNVGLAAALASGQGPTGDSQVWIDQMVADRTERSVADQIAEWNEVGPAFERLLLEQPQMGALVVDVVVHEHDLAGALGTQSDRTAAELGLVLDMMSGVAKRDLAANELGAIDLVTDAGTWHWGEGDTGLEVRGSLFEVFRLSGGRRSMAQLLASDHTGDIAAYTPGLSHNPLPDVDIDE